MKAINCPFCLSEQTSSFRDSVINAHIILMGDGFLHVKCWKCNGFGPGAKTVRGAIIKWNMREGKQVVADDGKELLVKSSIMGKPKEVDPRTGKPLTNYSNAPRDVGKYKPSVSPTETLKQKLGQQQ